MATKKISFTVEIEYDESLLEHFNKRGDGGKDELAFEATEHLEEFISDYYVGYKNLDKVKISYV